MFYIFVQVVERPIQCNRYPSKLHKISSDSCTTLTETKGFSCLSVSLKFMEGKFSIFLMTESEFQSFYTKVQMFVSFRN